MFDIGWSELAVIAIVALVVLGPKELASSMRTLGQWAGKARGLAQEFRRGLDDLARESEIDKVKEQFDTVRNFDLGRHIDTATDGPSTAAQSTTVIPTPDGPPPAAAVTAAAEKTLAAGPPVAGDGPGPKS
ncbi:MAG: twin-arginine translocase subunit TatB [Alphaproteobacteria bacterium]|nr:twin-arginine translocase subunit TatB [Alphaproteobacteria bacterium]